MSLLDLHKGYHDSILIIDISVMSVKNENGTNYIGLDLNYPKQAPIPDSASTS